MHQRGTLVLLNLFLGNNAAHSVTGKLELDIVRFDLYYDNVFFCTDDGTYDTTSRDNDIARLQLSQHLLLLLLLPLHGQKEQEIENGCYRYIGNDSEQSVRLTGPGL